MHSSEPSSDKTPHNPDQINGAGSGKGLVVLSNGEQCRRKIVVVGLGMVALSFMCVAPELSSFLRHIGRTIGLLKHRKVEELYLNPEEWVRAIRPN
jgi:hypothetical protein